MKESILKRIRSITEADTPEKLSKHLCPFYEKGSAPRCLTCMRQEDDFEECKSDYLSAILKKPMDVWEPSFEAAPLPKKREKVSLESISGGMSCDSCYISDKCPFFEEGSACSIDWEEGCPNSPQDMMDYLIKMQYTRVQRASLHEKLDGGVPDANLSSEMDRLNNLTAAKANLSRERLSISVEAEGSASSGGGGILAKLFGGGPSSLPQPSVTELPERSKSLEGSAEIADFEEVKEPIKEKR